MINTICKITTATPEECEKISDALAERLNCLSENSENGNDEQSCRFFTAAMFAESCSANIALANNPANFPGENLEATTGAAP